MSDRPNVVLVVMDTARAADVARPDVTPNLHALAGEGVTFENAFTTAPWTLPSHASLFTGQYTTDHGTHAGSRTFDPDVPPLAACLRGAGYRTACVSNNTWISPVFGFDRGFDDEYLGWELLRGGADLPTIAAERDGLLDQAAGVARALCARDGHRTLVNALYAKLLRKRYDDGALLTNLRIRRWLRARADEDRPFFLFVNYLEPHLEYRPPRGYERPFLPPDVDEREARSVEQDAWSYIAGKQQLDERDFRALRALYRGELRYLDERIGRLYGALDDAVDLDETVFVVVGDHGENVGEHGLMDHQYCLYDTLTHVPLVVRYPRGLDPGVDRGLVELRDLYPGLLNLADVDPPDDPTVSSHDPFADGGREQVLAEYVTPQPSMETLASRVGELPPSVRRYDRGLRSIRTERWKYVEGTDGSARLYDLEADPGETSDVAAEHPAVCSDLAGELRRRRGELGVDGLAPAERDGDAEVEPGARKRLEDLGYLQ